MTELSVIIITKNAEATIQACLDSVKWADEIIVLDSGSQDETRTICQRYTQQVHLTDWPGYGKQKQRALAKASKKWVLSLDADERLSTALQKEIKSHIKQQDIAGYELPIKLVFHGQTIHYANGSCYHLRLFQREYTAMSTHDIHERFCVQGRTRRAQAPVYHHSFSSVSHFVDKINRYSSLKAQCQTSKAAYAAPSILRAITHGLSMFLRIYIINGGILDGKAGFVLAAGFAQQSYYRYVKEIFPD